MVPSDQETLRLIGKLALPSRGKLRLLVLSEGVHAVHELPALGDVTIGRGEDAEIRIEDRSISRRHAQLHIGPTLRVKDLGSANGTRVRERLLEPNETVEVAPGDAIELGTAVVVLQREATADAGSWQLLSHVPFVDALSAACMRGGTFGVVRMHVVGSLGASSIHQVFAKVLRSGDTLASYGPAQYELLVQGMGPTELESLVSHLVASLQAQGAKVQTGLACAPRDGNSPEALIAACSTLKSPDGAPAVSRDGAMERIYKLIDRIAPSNINVLLLGETGVGKEVMAERVHKRSKRAEKPFLRLNCAALSETLLESELFGHEKGAFTGAVRSKPGLLETAAGGTVLLDEVGELPPSIQAKLLRVLEERQVMRVGGLKKEPIDVRFVFATNRDLEAEVARGAFRQDLYYRLNGIALVIPPLRDRTDEIERLAREFAAHAAKQESLPVPSFSRDAMELMLRYPWPGNIRELRNVIERAILLCIDGVILPEHLSVNRPRPVPPAASPVAGSSAVPLVAHDVAAPSSGAPQLYPALPQVFQPPAVPPATLGAPPQTPATPQPAFDGKISANLKDEREAAERRAIVDALERCGGNQTKAAQLLGVSRRTLVARIQAYNLPRRRTGKPVAEHAPHDDAQDADDEEAD